MSGPELIAEEQPQVIAGVAQESIESAAPQNAIVVAGPAVVVRSDPRYVLAPGRQGPQGKQGPVGPQGGSNGYTAIAAVDIGGQRVVRLTATGLVYADATQTGSLSQAYGLSASAAAMGETVNVTAYGPVTEPSWNWSLGPVFLGVAGALTQSPPTAPSSVFSLVVGYAIGAQTVFIDPQPPITLAV
ncbi:hypothetical protein [Fimbriiglobus ruber]|uniref:hypothetical protein n=1 Tax=Fimbriiglobus ruber TaxID=1908690 RepID=UPI000B4A9A1C|nr:hypothetical protein [Fimbriiglobus ruber]